MRKKLISVVVLTMLLSVADCSKNIAVQGLTLVNKSDAQVSEAKESMPNLNSIAQEINEINSEQIIEEKQEEKTITIASVGDIMMHDAQIKSGALGNGNYDYSRMFKSIKPYIEKADFALGNLETTFSGKEKSYTGYPQFNSPEILAQNIRDAGFDLVTTANNHSLDRRFYGIEKTIENLDKAGLLHTGTFKTKEDSQGILIEDIKGIKVAFLAYTYGTNGITIPEKFAVNLIDRSKMLEEIKKAKYLKADIVIASVHFGIEYVTKQNKTQEDIVNFLFNSGVDIVLGSHPHVLQPAVMKSVKDIYGIEKDRFVIYSQGNILANMPERYKDSGVILNLEIKKNCNGTVIEKVEYIPTVVDAYYNSEAKKTTFEILPIFSQEDYSKHIQNAVIRQSFKDSTAILQSTNPKIGLKTKE